MNDRNFGIIRAADSHGSMTWRHTSTYKKLHLISEDCQSKNIKLRGADSVGSHDELTIHVFMDHPNKCHILVDQSNGN